MLAALSARPCLIGNAHEKRASRRFAAPSPENIGSQRRRQNVPCAFSRTWRGGDERRANGVRIVKKLLLAAALAVAAPSAANAVSITVGWWDWANGVGSGVTQIYTQPNGNLFTIQGNIFGPNFGGVLSALVTDNGYYESAINDIYASKAATA